MLDLDLEYIIPEQGRLAIQNDNDQNNKFEKINIYPNPAFNKITISTNLIGVLDIKDLTEKTVVTVNCLYGNTDVNVATFQS